PLVWDQDDETAIRADEGGVFVTFGGPPRHARNRLRLGLAADDLHNDVDRLVGLGATRVSEAEGHLVLADPDGNELILQDR
ncbi:MAG: hypothetical protein QOE45_719, partial [Frankiaceae bacterium]|nr:hypothetical protein [Frankiaceae bacterium]